MAKKSQKLPVASPKPVPVKIVSEPASTKSDAAYEEREKKWRAESDLRTLKEAEEIRRDKERMKGAKAHAKSEMNSLKKIC